MRVFGRREKASATPNPQVLRQRLDALAGVDLRLPNYHEFSVLARGGSSVVFLARERRIDRPVAIKVLPPEKELHAAKQFEREKEIAVSLGRHPYIVQVFDAGSASDGSPFLVMEYFERGSLADRLRAEGPLPVEESLSIIEKIGSALQAAHDAGILHRDVKPSNILFSEYGPSLSDFGISRSMSRGEWTQSLAHFTPWHSAPEILEGDNPSIASDVYSLASTLFTSLDGRPPFVLSGDDRSLAYQLRVLRDPLPTLLRRDLPVGLHDILVKAMAKLPADRFDSVLSFLVALRALPIALPTTATSSSLSTATSALGLGGQVQAIVSAPNDGQVAELSNGSDPLSEASFERPLITSPEHAGPGNDSVSAPSSDTEDDAMFRPPPFATATPASNSDLTSVSKTVLPAASGGTVEGATNPNNLRSTPSTTGSIPVEFVQPNQAGRIGGEPGRNVVSGTHAVRAAASQDGVKPAQSSGVSEVRLASSVHEQRNEQGSGAVRAATTQEQRSPSEEEATVLGQRRIVAPVPPAPPNRQVPLAWIALLVTALLGGLAIAFYPSKRAPKPVIPPVAESVVGVQPSVVVSSLVPVASTPPVDRIPRVSASSPQQVTITEKLDESGEFSLAEIRWTDGTPPLVAAYVAASKQGGEPKAEPIADAALKRAVIVGIDPKAAYCFWVVAFDTAVRPIVQYRSEQQCVRGGVPYNFQ